MLNKILLLSIITSLSACESINQAKQCDADKNYIISNPEAIKEYQRLKSDGKIKSYYLNNQNQNICNDNKCVGFDPEQYDFIEMYFNDEIRKGIYTITASKDLENKDCFKTYEMSSEKQKKYCYIAIKNKDNEIKSQYEWKRNINNNIVNLEFSDIKNNKNLFNFSYQAYSTGAIGGPGGGICPQACINHPEFKFNPYAFP